MIAKPKTELHQKLTASRETANNHHHIGYALAFPSVTYKRFKNGKTFIYDNRPKSIKHGQMPIAEIVEPNHLVYQDKVVFRGTVKSCLAYAQKYLLTGVVV